MGGLLHLKKRSDIDMTNGSIVGALFTFALPLFLGNLFQQFYNWVDTWVIGQTGETAAYAAVGSVTPIINILIGTFMGLSGGAGVVISQYYGAKNRKGVQKAVHTSMVLVLVLGVVFTAIGVLATPLMLRLMLDTEEAAAAEIYGFAKEYLTIYFAGLMGLMVYNIGAGILRAIGDSRHPFYFLIFSAVVNIVLDLLFVFRFGMGVRGVAYATIIAQGLSAILTLYVLFTTTTEVRVSLGLLRVDFGMLKKIVQVGIPAAFQMAITAFSNIFVQSYISKAALAGGVTNASTSLGAWTTYSKIDQMVMMPLQAFSMAVTTFVGQNRGKGDLARASRGTRIGYLMATASALLLMTPILLFAPTLARIFQADAEIIHYATILLRYLTPFYLLCCVNQVFSGALRGAGNSTAPMVIMLSSFVGFRQLYLFIMSNYISNELLPMAFSYPAGWLLCAITTLLYYRFYKYRGKSLAEAATTVKSENMSQKENAEAENSPLA